MTSNPYRRALDGWGPNGWIKGSLRDEAGGRCMVGRLGQVGEHEHRLLSVTIEEQYPERRVTIFGVDGLLFASDPLAIIIDFNDHDDTEYPDIQMVLEKAAVKWEETQ